MTPYPAVRVEIKQSQMMQGEVGLFATRLLKKDTVVLSSEYFSTGKTIKWKDFNKKFDSITKKKIMAFCPGTPEGFFAPNDLNYISIAWYMNHCCNPNIGFNQSNDFVAMKNIKKGEELCWDYGFDETNPKFKMKCFCKQYGCRGSITGNDWKKIKNDVKKFKYFSPKLKEFISLQKQK